MIASRYNAAHYTWQIKVLTQLNISKHAPEKDNFDINIYLIQLSSNFHRKKL